MNNPDYDTWLERDIQERYKRQDYIEQTANDLMFAERTLDPCNVDAFLAAIHEHGATESRMFMDNLRAALKSEELHAPGMERKFFETLGSTVWRAVFNCLHERALEEAARRYDYIMAVGRDNDE